MVRSARAQQSLASHQRWIVSLFWLAAVVMSGQQQQFTATTVVSAFVITTGASHSQSRSISLPPSISSSTACRVATSSSTDYEIVKVDLEDGRDYPIYIGTGFSDEQASELLKSHVTGNKVLIITNDRIAPMYLEKYRSFLERGGDKQVDTLVLPDGEEYKNIEVLQLILDKALELALDRKATFVALGGGVIGDMVGFAAAIYQRGINFIQVCATQRFFFGK